MSYLIREHILRLLSGKRTLDVQDAAWHAAWIAWITYFADNTVRMTEARVRSRTKRVDVQVDLNSEITAAFAHGITKVFSAKICISSHITANNVFTFAPHQLVNSQIFEMPAI